VGGLDVPVAGSWSWVVDGRVEGKCFGEENGLKRWRSGDGEGAGCSGLVGGRRWRAPVSSISTLVFRTFFFFF